MDILGIGPLELVFIILIAIIIFGPKDLVKAGRTLGRLLRQILKSPTWMAIQETSREIRNIPTRLVREAGLDEDLKDIQTIMPKPVDLNSSFPKSKNEPDDQNKGIENNKQKSDTEEFSEWLTPPSELSLNLNKSQSSDSLSEEQV